MEPLYYRKLIRRYDEPGHLHFLTFSCYRRMPLLANDLIRSSLARRLDKALDKHRFRLAGFVFMPEHVHLLIWPLDGTYSIAAFQHSFKRPFSAQVKSHFESLQSPLLKKLTVRERPGVMVFRFWQEGGGYDQNVWSEKYIWKTIDYMHNNR